MRLGPPDLVGCPPAGHHGQRRSAAAALKTDRLETTLSVEQVETGLSPPAALSAVLAQAALLL